MARRHVQPTYFQLSRSPHYSLAFAIPLLIAYEGFALFLNHSDLYGIRNSADVLLKLCLAYIGIHGFFGFGAAMVVALILFRIVGGGPRLGPIRFGVLLWMLAESLVYSLVFGTIVGAITHLLFAQPFPLSRSAQILVSLGAGIYEEFVFRVLLLAIFCVVCCVSRSPWPMEWQLFSAPSCSRHFTISDHSLIRCNFRRLCFDLLLG
jgi:hypothetical protein